MVNNLPEMQETRFQSLGWEDPLKKRMAIHSSILAWKLNGQRSLVGYSPWGCKESNMTDQLTFSLIKLVKMRDSLVVHTSTAGGAGLIPGRRTKILPAGLETKVPHASRYS